MSSVSQRNHKPSKHLKLVLELTRTRTAIGHRRHPIPVVLNEKCPHKHKHFNSSAPFSGVVGEVMGSVPLGTGSEN